MQQPIMISPSILAADFLNLGRDIDAVSNADYIHVDVMDGHFVPNLSYGTTIVEAAKRATRIPLDVHMMVSNPDETVDWYVDAGADLISVHVEAARDLPAIVTHLHERGVKAGVVINPATPVEVLEDVIELVDLVLVMSVNPGFGGQGFIEGTYDKVRALSAICSRREVGPIIEVDGGVSLSNARALAAAGAQMLVAGSAVFKSPDPASIVREMRELASLGLECKKA
ncbi:ribulose-phosphate 3-epimerase [Collinsella tanakaei]|uniref:ribulose-phosphate 3-epimerase n=1 Tax=Collinsella tanakaei TaxID=626935 RepID=UPI001F492B9A|nr:ribulose-phosphate 3-epimerase [Collinsella tanakaei]MCF2620843.1 ribulose-phosphate 3-epimerase [Collinsella tanakaei]